MILDARTLSAKCVLSAVRNVLGETKLIALLNFTKLECSATNFSRASNSRSGNHLSRRSATTEGGAGKVESMGGAFEGLIKFKLPNFLSTLQMNQKRLDRRRVQLR